MRTCQVRELTTLSVVRSVEAKDAYIQFNGHFYGVTARCGDSGSVNIAPSFTARHM